MDRSEIYDAVARLFEAARERPGDDYDADRFLAFLTSRPGARGRRPLDGFAARRRFVGFLEAVQLELGVCFTRDEWDSGYSLAGFVALVEKKLVNPESTRRLAIKRSHEARRAIFDQTLKVGILIGVLLSILMVHPSWILRITVASLWVAAMGAVAAVNVMDYRYSRKLVARVSGSGD